jgi:hypothetical protein
MSTITTILGFSFFLFWFSSSFLPFLQIVLVIFNIITKSKYVVILKNTCLLLTISCFLYAMYSFANPSATPSSISPDSVMLGCAGLWYVFWIYFSTNFKNWKTIVLAILGYLFGYLFYTFGSLIRDYLPYLDGNRWIISIISCILYLLFLILPIFMLQKHQNTK